jgi:hypothetical protein
MPGMPMPEWAGDLKRKMVQAFETMPNQANAGVVELTPVTEFSSHFAEFTIREKDLILHFFPRAGEEDEWYEASFLNRCSRCRRELSEEVMRKRQPCPACKCPHRVYIPARREVGEELAFPPNVLTLIKEAIDAAWMGEASVVETSLLYYDKKANIIHDEPEEVSTGSVAVQLRGAANTAIAVGIEKFVDKICSELDTRLEPDKT